VQHNKLYILDNATTAKTANASATADGKCNVKITNIPAKAVIL